MQFSIPAQSLAEAINQFGRQTGLQVTALGTATAGLKSPGVSGELTTREALERLLRGTGLTYRFTDDQTVTLLPAPQEGSAVMLPTIPVEARAPTEPQASMLPEAYPGGQVARGGRIGLLGNRDFMDTPFNQSSYTSAVIENQHARTIADVVANDPSVRIVSPESNGSEVFNIRGFALNNQDVSFDGLYGILPYWKASVASAERVEVLKGPNALLNGMAPSGNVGGSINIVPKRADDTPLTRFTGNYVSDENFGGHIDAGRRFGADNAFGARFNGVYRTGDVGRTNEDQGDATLGLDYRGDRLRLSSDLGYAQLRMDKVEGLLSMAAGASLPSPPDAAKSYYQPWTYWNTQAFYGAFRAEYDITDAVTAFAAVGGRRYREEYLFPFGFGLTSAGNFTEGFAYSSNYYDSKTAEGGVRAKAETGPVDHLFSVAATTLQQESGTLAGTASTHASSIYDPSFISRPDLAPLGDAPKTGETELNSLGVADVMSVLDDRAQLSIGVRQQRVAVGTFNGTTGIKTASYNDSALTPMVGVVLKPWENVSFYGNYIEGLTQGPTATTGSVNAGQIFPPMKSKQREVGIKVDHGGFATTLSAFEITKPNGFMDPTTLVYGVDGEQRNRGIELNTFGEIADGLRLLGGIMYLDAVQTKTSGGTNNGKSAVGIPDIQLNMGLEWDVPHSGGLTLMGRVIYTGDSSIDAANTQTVPDWTRFDIGARYTLERNGTPITFRANIENLFDNSYWMSSSLYRGSPRTFLLSASVDF